MGKTSLRLHFFNNSRKHPHGRGEDSGKVTTLLIMKETPPRAWGRPC
ncbi:hypothetical protein BMETH_147_14 [methanotrophic bacterial endosymbiont of Bathymodiolus sp.]|nr:hypothetical protein BMETH_147_14 [methanotrophic bacterial endosymbiont of Bathymodiolus sp.]